MAFALTISWCGHGGGSVGKSQWCSTGRQAGNRTTSMIEVGRVVTAAPLSVSRSAAALHTTRRVARARAQDAKSITRMKGKEVSSEAGHCHGRRAERSVVSDGLVCVAGARPAHSNTSRGTQQKSLQSPRSVVVATALHISLLFSIPSFIPDECADAVLLQYDSIDSSRRTTYHPNQVARRIQARRSHTLRRAYIQYILTPDGPTQVEHSRLSQERRLADARRSRILGHQGSVSPRTCTRTHARSPRRPPPRAQGTVDHHHPSVW